MDVTRPYEFIGFVVRGGCLLFTGGGLATASERGSGRQILETSIENGSSEVAFLEKALSEATQYGYR